MSTTNKNLNEREPQNLTSVAEVEDAKLARIHEKPKSQGRIVLERFVSHKPAMVSSVILIFITVFAFSSIGWGPLPGWWGQNFYQAGAVIDGGKPTLSLVPTWLGGEGIRIGEHPFGQDSVGKDYFALVMNGTQKSIIIGVVVGLVATFLGTVIGAVSGYFRGWVDEILMRITDLFIVIPLLVLAAVLGKMAGASTGSIIILALVLGLVTWTGLARLVRGEILSLREREYVAAAQAMGSKTSRVIFKHLIPNTMGVIIVNATFAIAGAILLESSLSYLGFGVKPPESSLGLLISQYQNAFTTRPYLFWWPGMIIVTIALSVNFLGDGLRDAFDPRQVGKKRRRRAGMFALPTRKEKP
ncbi:ABC transporter permease [Glutamicibacter sp. MCAF14]|jgi:peptide/nickel transport system permease protein|uniref:ABC transporter permease n=1 Tax=Glutamicibacter sp. MCAF14 TaxID=3233043 RepID=UPI003F931F09